MVKTWTTLVAGYLIFFVWESRNMHRQSLVKIIFGNCSPHFISSLKYLTLCIYSVTKVYLHCTLPYCGSLKYLYLVYDVHYVNFKRT